MKYRKGEVIPFIIRAIGKITQATNKDFEKLRLQQQRDAFQSGKWIYRRRLRNAQHSNANQQWDIVRGDNQL